MGIEIERKFLVQGEPWHEAEPGTLFLQGYVSTDPDRSLRVRLAGNQAWITLKSRSVAGVRPEYEYEIPAQDAQELLTQMCLQPLIEKTRYRIPHADVTWEIDVFHGIHQGLVVAEVELPSVHHPLTLPSWVGQEVTGDFRYSNSRLIEDPDAWKKV
jgi:adenylate cyclase